MEQGSKKPEEVGSPTYKIVWHPAIRADLARIPRSTVESIAKAVDHRLARAPHLLGTPLRGTTSMLWRIRFGRYRVVYTIHARFKEVWVLSVQRRDIVYRDPHLFSLLQLAIALQQSSQTKP
ncbi:MAG: type II toxin-antitoxin system RelE/ParE family toxin [Candidatus Omnitrophica bacterium]|nr:type II toxin-antitoxin system RelE/ParE family toxin [Candidatus Omnitrophota bacterium]